MHCRTLCVTSPHFETNSPSRGSYQGSYISEKNKGGRRNHTVKPLPKTAWTAPPMIRFPPGWLMPVIVVRENGHRPDESHFLRPPKLVLEGALYSTSPPPKNRTMRFADPPLRLPKHQSLTGALLKSIALHLSFIPGYFCKSPWFCS